MTDSIREMARDVADLRSFEKHETAAYAALALAGEVGELCNYLKKELRGDYSKQKEIEAEVPDILFYLIQFCKSRGISISEEWDKKMLHNSIKYSRPLSRKF